jgi:hypothetical protein
MTDNHTKRPAHRMHACRRCVNASPPQTASDWPRSCRRARFAGLPAKERIAFAGEHPAFVKSWLTA